MYGFVLRRMKKVKKESWNKKKRGKKSDFLRGNGQGVANSVSIDAPLVKEPKTWGYRPNDP